MQRSRGQRIVLGTLAETKLSCPRLWMRRTRQTTCRFGMAGQQPHSNYAAKGHTKCSLRIPVETRHPLRSQRRHFAMLNSAGQHSMRTDAVGLRSANSHRSSTILTAKSGRSAQAQEAAGCPAVLAVWDACLRYTARRRPLACTYEPSGKFFSPRISAYTTCARLGIH